jgi:hypothetical protein
MAQVRYLGLFPFCVTPTDDGSLVGDGTWYPLGFTKEEVCALYWKNKSYNIACTDSGSITYGGEITSSWERGATGVVNYYSDSSTFVPTVETDFICADVASKSMIWQADTFPDNQGRVYLFGYEFWNGFGYSFTTNCYYYNNQYYPLMFFDGPVGYTSTRDWATVSNGWTQEQVDLISVTATCTFLGRTVPLYWLGNVGSSTINESGETVYVTSGTAGGSMVITLNEQWPYDP